MPGDNHIAIIGNGIAGTTAARHIRKLDSNARITLISAETEHFFSRTALMYVYMGHMRYKDIKPYEDQFWKKNRIQLVFDYVESIDTQNKSLQLKAGGKLNFDRLLLATGSVTNVPPWEGTGLKKVQGLYSWQDVEELERNTEPWGEEQIQTRHAVIIGGGLIGVELAEMLRTRDIDVTMLVREGRYWGNVLPEEEARMVEREIERHGVRILTNRNVKALEGDESGAVIAVCLEDGERLKCDLVGITTGVKPNVEFLEGSGIETDKGILVDEYLQTNVQDVYSAGDCAQIKDPVEGHLSIEPIWYTGRMMGEVAACNLVGKKEAYQPGPWFNSAKFFNIEYQNYGRVPAEENDAIQFFTWQSEKRKKLLKVAFHKTSNKFLGINLFGIRMRHEKFDKWLREGATVQEVLSGLRDADFETEFEPRFYQNMVDSFNEQFGESVKLKKRRRKMKLAFWR